MPRIEPFTDGIMIVLSDDYLERRRLRKRGFIKIKAALVEPVYGPKLKAEITKGRTGSYLCKGGELKRLNGNAADLPIAFFTDFRGLKGFARWGISEGVFFGWVL